MGDGGGSFDDGAAAFPEPEKYNMAGSKSDAFRDAAGDGKRGSRGSVRGISGKTGVRFNIPDWSGGAGKRITSDIYGSGRFLGRPSWTCALGDK